MSSEQPPILLYRQHHDVPEGTLRQAKSSKPATAANQLLRGLTWAILGVVLIFWAILGAIFWIPLILRSMVMFSITLIEATLEGKKPGAAARILRDSVTFYKRGFVVATDVILKDEVGEGARDTPSEGRLFREILWAVVIWYFILLILGFIETSPIDAWNWWVSLPWGDALDTLLAPLRG
jgi:hypothetical protein